MWPDADRNLYQRFDIEGNGDGKQETISENEGENRSCEFTTTFDPLLYTEPVRIVNDRRDSPP
jgi:hypothetical protein